MLHHKIAKAKLINNFSFDEFIKYHSLHGIKIAPGASKEQIADLERSIDFVFPNDFKEFHSQCNGFLDGDMMEGDYVSIWTFDRILEEYGNAKNEDYDFIPIADYLINSHWYGYIREENGIYADYDICLLYTSPSPRDLSTSRMPSSA